MLKPDDERQVGVLEGEARIAEQAGRRLLDHPDPERLAVDRRAVEVHQDGLHGPVDADGVDGVVGAVAQQRSDVRERVRREGHELDAAVAGVTIASTPSAPDAETAVAGRVERRPVRAVERARVQGRRTRRHPISTTCTCFGPCTPCVSVISMSAVRLGPAMTTTLLASSSRPGPSANNVAEVRRRAIDGHDGDVHRAEAPTPAGPARARDEDDGAAVGQRRVGTGHADHDGAELAPSGDARPGSDGHVVRHARCTPLRRQRARAGPGRPSRVRPSSM